MLLAGHKKNAYWYGSQLSIEEARKLAPYNNATSLQVTVAVLAGMIWAMENPNRGIVEPDEMDFRRNLEICMPYLGPVVGRVHRLDAAARPRAAVPGRPRQVRSVAVQERARDLVSRALAAHFVLDRRRSRSTRLAARRPRRSPRRRAAVRSSARPSGASMLM